MGYDELLDHIGKFGWYQKRLWILLTISIFPNAMHNFSIIFNMQVPRFRCAVPGLDNDTFSFQSQHHARLVNESIPFIVEENTFSQCTSYQTSTVSDTTNRSSGFAFSNKLTVKCLRWVYDQGENEKTVSSDLNLVCDNEIFVTHSTMVVMLGLFFGSILCGPMADLIGRKKMLLIMLLSQSIFGITFGFVSSVAGLLILRCLISMACVGAYIVAFVLVSEVVSPNKRTFVSLGIMYGFCVSLFINVFVNYFIRDWTVAQFVFSTPGILFVSYWWLILESPRWLLSKGRYHDARDIMKKMADINRIEFSEKLFAQHSGEANRNFNAYAEREEIVDLKTKTSPLSSAAINSKDIKFWHIFRNPRVLIIFLVMFFNWFTINLCYYGLSLNVGSLIEGDLYLNNAIMAAMETLSCVLCQVLVDRVGRKSLFFTCMVIGGLACLATMGPVLAESDDKWINTVLSSIGKFSISACFGIIYIFTIELLPTVIRNTGVGICSFMGRIGGLVSPYIAIMGSLVDGPFSKALPLMIFGCCTILAGFLTLLVPETLNITLPETFEDVVNIKRRRKTVDVKEEPGKADIVLLTDVL